MKRYLRPVGALVVLAALVGGVCAAATGDSLISLSYWKETLFPKAVQAGEEAANSVLQDSYDKAKAELDEVHAAILGGEEGGGLYSQTLASRTWTDGQTITLNTGSGFLMADGVAAVTHSGAVVDVTAGTEVPSGSLLTAGHRYLVGEGTAARIAVRSGEAVLGIQGVYTAESGAAEHTPFYDVSQSDWFYAAVGYAYENELFFGVDDHHFAPAQPMARAQLVSVLYRLAGSPTGESEGAPDFSDVPDGQWYTDSVRWAAANGITAGTSSTTFSPGLTVTREQVAAMLYNYASKYLGLDVSAQTDLTGYGDLDKLSQWARPAMSWAVDRGIISGASNNGVLTLDPQRSASRAEMSIMLKSFCEKIL